MIEHEGFLFTLAEVSATVIGFSLVVGAIRPDAGLRRASMYDVALAAECGHRAAASPGGPRVSLLRFHDDLGDAARGTRVNQGDGRVGRCP